MAEFIRLDLSDLSPLRQIDEQLVSAGIETAEPPKTEGSWSPIFSDTPWALSELGDFCALSDEASCRNTLLKYDSLQSQPTRFCLLLWNRLMGRTVYGTGHDCVYCHSRKDGREGLVFLIINNRQEIIYLDIPCEAQRYSLTASGHAILLNGRVLTLDSQGALPELQSSYQSAGTLRLAPQSCTFLVI